ncbi:MAG: hypothetical protein LBT60_01860 [Oscillospiraceae bacterium]|jgi:hypothetical protein|nr:hypothetical protein [Oscillospiraceae bacterium]
MRKISLLTACMLLLSLTACAKGDARASPPAATAPPPVVTASVAPTAAPIPTPSPTPTPTPTPVPTPTPIPEVVYEGEIYHIFFHCLIAFPEISYRNGYSPLDQDCVLVDEFNRCLQQLYDNGYALIDINETFAVSADGQVTRRAVMVPEGKKPFILTVDDMVYDPRKMGTGMVDKLILDDEGKIATYTRHKDGTEVVAYDNEIPPILETFIAAHPDFSIRGARGLLAMTGFAGVFGYRTDRLSATQAAEIEAAKPVTEALRALGWTFASHGYGHRDAPKISESLFLDDTRKWRNEVENLTGPTPIYVYPYGHPVSHGGAKFKTMQEYGFKVMCGVSHKQVWEEQGDALYMTRLGIDGYSLRNYGQYLAPLFDCAAVIDTQYRK